MRTMNALEERVAKSIQQEIQNHHKNMLSYAHLYDLMGGLHQLFTELKESTGVQSVSFDCLPSNFYAHVYLTKQGRPSDLSQLLFKLLEHDGWEAKPSTSDVSGYNYRFANGEYHITLFVNPHYDSDNCVKVQVGTAPVYEWKCKDPEPVLCQEGEGNDDDTDIN